MTTDIRTQHTPGEWTVKPWMEAPQYWYRTIGTRDWGVCQVQLSKDMPFAERDKPVQDANAHLIAAAPDLLEALEAIWNALRADAENGQPFAYETNGRSCAMADAAIAKAKGQ